MNALINKPHEESEYQLFLSEIKANLKTFDRHDDFSQALPDPLPFKVSIIHSRYFKIGGIYEKIN